MIALNERLICINDNHDVKARWQQKLSLHNPDSTLPLAAVTMVTEYDGKQAVDSDLLLHYKQLHQHRYARQQDSEQWQQPCFKLKITLQSTISDPLYCALFYFDARDGYIGSELLQGVWLTANEAPDAWAFDANFIPTSVAENLRQQGMYKTHDFIKLVVSKSAFNTALFHEEGLTVDNSVNVRGLRVKPKQEPYADWMSKTIKITTIYPDNNANSMGEGK